VPRDSRRLESHQRAAPLGQFPPLNLNLKEDFENVVSVVPTPVRKLLNRIAHLNLNLKGDFANFVSLVPQPLRKLRDCPERTPSSSHSFSNPNSNPVLEPPQPRP
jgi:hypothetical protein